ncbi:hypothetical protein RSP795_10260 [Ralstonia solanacearum]|nr:hypothetical protein RSP795_10260 [Ralstonia solanacearum]
MSPPVPRWVLDCLAAVLVLTVGLVYRSHVYDSGFDAGTAAAHAQATAALEGARKADAAVAAKTVTDLQAQLKKINDAHDAREATLKAALDASGLRVTRLSAALARLHDAAASGSGVSADPSATGSPAGEAETDYSVADLIQTAEENYAICNRNSARFAKLQSWYRSLSGEQPDE